MPRKERRPDFLNNLATYFVAEARRNEEVLKNEIPGFLPGREVDKTLLSLAHQLPNRVYASRDGKLGRVVFFSDREWGIRCNAYLELLTPEGETDWTSAKRETIITGGSHKAVEEHIVRWRNGFSLTGDLIREPDAVYRTEGYSQSGYAHSVFEGDEKVTCYYYPSIEETPRFVGFSRGQSSDKAEIGLSPLSYVPIEMIRYSNPFWKGDLLSQK